MTTKTSLGKIALTGDRLTDKWGIDSYDLSYLTLKHDLTVFEPPKNIPFLRRYLKLRKIDTDELLPIVRCHHLLEQIDVEGNVLGLDARRHEDAAQHLVLGGDAGFLARGNVGPRHVGRHLGRVDATLRIEQA